MQPDRKTEPAFDAAWLDIPDPAAGFAAGSARPGASEAQALVPSSPTLTRRDVARRRALALGVALGWPLIVLVLWGLREGARELLGFLVIQGVTWMALLVAALLSGVSSGRRGLGRPVRAAMVAGGAPVVFMLLALVWLPEGPSAPLGELGTTKELGQCVGLALLVMGPVLVASAWALRRAFPSGAVGRGAAVGAASGLAATLVSTMHCGVTLGGHVALAHGAPVVLGALVGALLGAKVERA